MKQSPRNRPRFGDGNFGSLRTGIAAGGVGLFLGFSVIGYLLTLMFAIKGSMQVLTIVGFGATAAFIALRFGLAVSEGAGQFVARFTAPSGGTTPYEHGFSYQQALAAKGDIAGALQSYEAVLRESPHQIEAHVQAAELYASSGNTPRAIELFRALRGIPTITRAREIYASNRLIDLYVGAGDEGRALVELRRLIERYPATDTALRAREALGNLKWGQSRISSL